jgi:hypothetical protein
MIRKRKNGLYILMLIILISPLAALSIGKIKADPQIYNGDIVRLRGEITFKTGIPFTDLLVYILEDKTGSIMVFSAFPKEREDRVSIKAEVVAYIGDENEDRREETIGRIGDYLVEKEILEKSRARRVAEVSLRFINSMADAVTGTWFVIEQEKSGFLNL